MFGLIRLVQAEESHNLGYSGVSDRFMQVLGLCTAMFQVVLVLAQHRSEVFFSSFGGVLTVHWHF